MIQRYNGLLAITHEGSSEASDFQAAEFALLLMDPLQLNLQF